MASEKRILTLTLIVLLVVFLSFNTVLPCWVLGQCSQNEEGFQEGMTSKQQLYKELSKLKGRDIDDLLRKMKADPSCMKGRNLDVNNCKALKDHPIGNQVKAAKAFKGAFAEVLKEK